MLQQEMQKTQNPVDYFSILVIIRKVSVPMSKITSNFKILP